MKFLCGCNIEVGKGSKAEKDEEGFFICPTHKVRLAGWRMPSHKPNFPAGIYGMTDLEYEAWRIDGTLPEKREIHVMTGTVPRRDSRDPVEDYDDIRASVIIDQHKHRVNGKSNVDKFMEEHHPVRRDGRALMEYQRDLATAQVISKTSKELTEREIGF